MRSMHAKLNKSLWLNIEKENLFRYRLNYIYSDITSILIFLVILGTFVVLHEIEKYEQIKYTTQKNLENTFHTLKIGLFSNR